MLVNSIGMRTALVLPCLNFVLKLTSPPPCRVPEKSRVAARAVATSSSALTAIAKMTMRFIPLPFSGSVAETPRTLVAASLIDLAPEVNGSLATGPAPLRSCLRRLLPRSDAGVSGRSRLLTRTTPVEPYAAGLGAEPYSRPGAPLRRCSDPKTEAPRERPRQSLGQPLRLAVHLHLVGDRRPANVQVMTGASHQHLPRRPGVVGPGGRVVDLHLPPAVGIGEVGADERIRPVDAPLHRHPSMLLAKRLRGDDRAREDVIRLPMAGLEGRRHVRVKSHRVGARHHRPDRNRRARQQRGRNRQP